MFGLKALFESLSRLTNAVSHSADLFEAANRQLEICIGLDTEPLPLSHVPDQIEERSSRRNGRK